MSTDQLDEVGSIDFVVVEFPRGATHFSGEIAAALDDLVELGLVRVLDLVLVRKDADGGVVAVEVADLPDEEAGPLRKFEADVAVLLSEEDVVALAEVLEPETVAGVVVWENRWSVPFASAVARAGGQLVASGRIPLPEIAAALEAAGLDDEQADGAIVGQRAQGGGR